MYKLRKPFQGTLNIIRFNRHFYLLPLALLLVFFLCYDRMNAIVKTAATITVFFVFGLTLLSLLVSSYVYDFSNLYSFDWLRETKHYNKGTIVNINAGFDEISCLLKKRFEGSELFVFDFYNPLKHTEVSIKRARKVYPPFPGTQQISTGHLTLPENYADKIFLFFSAHEIRNDNERLLFFKELRRVLNERGQIILTEHLRDGINFLAYNIGFFHFHSKAKWFKTFQCAGLQITGIVKITPFVTTFILEKNGTAS